MKKIFLLIILFSLFYNSLISQTFEKVPKQYSLDLGYNYILTSDMANIASSGYGFMFDYAWKLSGFGEKKAVYLSVPISYTYFTEPGSSLTNSQLNYGWTVRHELAKNKKSIPFVGYALLLNTYKNNVLEGGIMGHQTKFEFGYNFMSDKNIKPFAKIEYNYQSYPSLGTNEKGHIQMVSVRFGVRFK
jgi:hypothetical protein